MRFKLALVFIALVTTLTVVAARQEPTKPLAKPTASPAPSPAKETKVIPEDQLAKILTADREVKDRGLELEMAKARLDAAVERENSLVLRVKVALGLPAPDSWAIIQQADGKYAFVKQ